MVALESNLYFAVRQVGPTEPRDTTRYNQHSWKRPTFNVSERRCARTGLLVQNGNRAIVYRIAECWLSCLHLVMRNIYFALVALPRVQPDLCHDGTSRDKSEKKNKRPTGGSRIRLRSSGTTGYVPRRPRYIVVSVSRQRPVLNYHQNGRRVSLCVNELMCNRSALALQLMVGSVAIAIYRDTKSGSKQKTYSATLGRW